MKEFIDALEKEKDHLEKIIKVVSSGGKFLRLPYQKKSRSISENLKLISQNLDRLSCLYNQGGERVTDRELFELPEDYVESTGLNKITFEVPFELFTKILKGYGYKLVWEDYRQIKIHPSTRTKKTVGQCQFLFSIWMNDHLKPAIKPSKELQKEPVRKIKRQKCLRKLAQNLLHRMKG